MKNLIGRGSGESVQMSFQGQGWVLVQPSEGRITAATPQESSSGGGLGGAPQRLEPLTSVVKLCG